MARKTGFIDAKKLMALSLSACLCGLAFFSGPLSANPQNGVVAAGSATITNNTNLTEIKQTTDKAIINWQSFSIGAAEETRFIQPSANAIVLNRVIGNVPSNILGRLTANGQVMLVNPAGIIFGAGSKIDVAGLIATTAKITDSDFLTGRFHFIQDPNLPATIINNGEISVAERGLVALVAPGVENNGVIRANLGRVALASGQDFTIDLYGDKLIEFSTGSAIQTAPVDGNGRTLTNLVANNGTIYAEGGKVLLTAKTAEAVVDNAISMGGVIQATSASMQNGVVILAGGDNGTVNISGKIDVSGKSSGRKGGSVKALGKKIQLTSTANIDASGDAGGGEILIGGNYQGKGPEQNAKTTSIATGALLNASALTQGDGGRIIVWADDYTDYGGQLFARGGAQGGNGGFAEVSGKEYLNYYGSADLTAPSGQTGQLLLDPRNIFIASSADTKAFTNPYTSTSDNSIISTTTLANALNTANVVIQTGSDGSQAGDIAIFNSIYWTSNNSLTLNAHNNIVFAGTGIDIINGTVTAGNYAGGTYGSGNMTFRADYDGNGVGTIVLNGSNPYIGTTGTIKYYYTPTYGASTVTPTTIVATYWGNPTVTPYMLITSASQLNAVSADSTVWNQNFALGSNVDASSISNFSPIGNSTTAFTGKFDGQGYSLNNLTINRSAQDNIGLFGYTTGATIQNIGMQNASITGRNFVGALVGYLNNNSTISKAFSIAGTISSGGSAVGGLVGGTPGGVSFTITQSFTTGTVTSTGSGQNGIGGLIGVANSFSPAIGTISNSYSLANVLGGSSIHVGGLIGYNNNTSSVSNSYSAGYVTSSNGAIGGLIGSNNAATISQSYWNMQTSGRASSAGGTSKNTSEMMTSTTFDGWDFAGPTWSIIDGTSYPYLAWAYTATPQIISGTVYAGQGTTATANQTINIALGGVNQATANSAANGFYYTMVPNLTLTNGAPVLAYLPSGQSVQGNTIALVNGANASLTGLSVYGNTVIARSDAGSSAPINNSHLLTAKGALSSGVLYSGTNPDITLSNNINFFSWGGVQVGVSQIDSTYNLNGNLTTAGSGKMDFQGPVSVGSTATLSTNTGNITFYNTLNGANNLTINSSAGTIYFLSAVGAITPLSGLTITGTTVINGGQMIVAGNQVFNSAISLGADTQFYAGGGDITSNGAINAAAYTATFSGNNITLNNANNNFASINLSADNNIVLQDANAINLNTTTVTNNFTLTAGGAISQTNAVQVGGTTTLNAGATGTINLTNSDNDFNEFIVSQAQNLNLTDVNALQLGSLNISGNIAITAGGNITQTANSGITNNGINSVATFSTDFAHDITLNTAFNDFTQVAISSSQNTTLNDLNDLELKDIIVGNNLTVTAAGAISQAANTGINNSEANSIATFTAGNLKDINLNSNLNAFTRVVINGGFNVTLNDTGNLELGNITAGNNLTLTATGAISQAASTAINNSGANSVATFTAGNSSDITLNAATNDFTRAVVNGGFNVTLKDNNNLELGNITADNNLTVTAAGAISQAASTTINNTGANSVATFTAGNSSDITLNAATNDFTRAVVNSGLNVTLVDNNNLELGNIIAGGNLTVTAANAISQAASTGINNSGANSVATFTAGNSNNISLTTNFNNFTRAVVNSGFNVALTDYNDLELGNITAGGNLTVTAAGAISQAASTAINNSGLNSIATFTAGSSSDITLNATTNDFTRAVVNGGLNVILTDANNLELGFVVADGNLTVNTAGTITQAANTRIDNTGVNSVATFTAGNSNDINLDSTTNNFTRAVINSAHNVTLADYSNLELGNITASGNLTVTAANAISQVANTSINNSGTNSVATFTAGNLDNISLNNALNDFTRVDVNDGYNINLADANNLVLGNIIAVNNLTVSAVGAISQAANTLITNNGVNSLATFAGGSLSNITLNNSNNDFTKVVVNSGYDVALRDTNNLVLGNTIVANNLNVTTSGAISQATSTAINNNNVNSMATFSAGNANNITLFNSSNDFTRVVVNSANNVTLRDVNNIELGNISANGNLRVTASGAISQATGATIINNGVNSIATFSGGSSYDVTLNNINNDFTRIAVNSGYNVALQDVNNIELGFIVAENLLSITSNGAMSQATNTLIQNNNANSIATFNAGSANNITLNNSDNDLTRVVIINGNDVVLQDANILVLGPITVAGNLNITTDGAISQAANTVISNHGVSSIATFDAGSANDISLNNSNNDFTRVVINNAYDVGLKDVNNIELGDITAANYLIVSAGAAISQAAGTAITNNGSSSLAVFRTSAAHDITLNNTNNDFNSLAVNNGNNVILNDINNLELANINIDGNLSLTAAGSLTQADSNIIQAQLLSINTQGGATLNNANIITAFAATNDSGNIELTNNATSLTLAGIAQSGAGDIIINQTGNLSTSGNISSNGAGSLLITVNGAGNDVNINNNISMNGNLIITAPDNFAVASGNTVSANAITLNANDLVLAGNLNSGSGNTTINANSSIDLGVAAAGAMQISGSELQHITAGNLTLNAGTDSAITINNITAANTAAISHLTLNATSGNAGSIIFQANPLTAQTLTVTADNGIAIQAPITTTVGALNINADFDNNGAGALTLSNNLSAAGALILTGAGINLGANVALSTSNAAITLNNAVNGSHNLTINSGAATTTFNAAVGNTTPIGSGNGAALTINSTGTTQFNSTLTTQAGIIVAGPTIFNDDVNLGASTIPVVSQFNGAINFNNMDFTAADGAIFNGVVTLTGGPISINANNSTLDFVNKIDGNSALTINTGSTGTTLLRDRIGSVTPLTNLVLNTNTLDLYDTVTSNSLSTNINNVNLKTTNNTIATGINLVNAGGNLTIASGAFNEAVTLNKNLNLMADNTVTLNSLTINTSAGISGDWVSSTGDFIFNAPLTLAGGVNLTAGNHDIIIIGTVSGNQIMTLNSNGNILIDGQIGAGTAVNRLVTNGNAVVQLGADITAQGGTIIFNNPVELTADVNLTDNGNTGIQFNNTLDGAYNLTLTAPTAGISFADAVGNSMPLGDLTINNAINVTANAAIFVNNFNQVAGSGTSTLAQLNAWQNINISTANISITGAIIGQTVSLHGDSGINGSVTANQLSLGGYNGGILTNTIVAGNSGQAAAQFATLVPSSTGQFYINGCLVGGAGCTPPPPVPTPTPNTNTSNSTQTVTIVPIELPLPIIKPQDVLPTEKPQDDEELACTNSDQANCVDIVINAE